MANRLVKFLKSRNIINFNQHGFQKGKNTGDAILHFLTNVYTIQFTGFKIVCFKYFN